MQDRIILRGFRYDYFQQQSHTQSFVLVINYSALCLEKSKSI